MSGSGQLPLALRFPLEQRFEGFVPADSREVVLLREAVFAGGRALLSGPRGSGKTHLLIAAAAAVDAVGRQVAYLPLAALGVHATAALDAQAPIGLLCIDDLDAVAGRADAERALFALHNRQGDAGGAIAYAARAQPDALAIGLPDLRSRLAHCLRIPLPPLDEAQRRALLVARARARGLALEAPALDYLFRRVGRDLATLTALLDRLDRESLAAQRRLSVPFLRSVLEGERS